jgi:hypothetical protein
MINRVASPLGIPPEERLSLKQLGARQASTLVKPTRYRQCDRFLDVLWRR